MPLIQIHHRLQGEEQMLEIFLLFNLYLKCMMKIKSHILPLIVLDRSKEAASQVNKLFAFGKVTAARLLFNQIWCESSEKPVGNMDGTIKQSSNGCQHPSGLFTGPSRSLTVSNATMTEKTTLNRKKETENKKTQIPANVQMTQSLNAFKLDNTVLDNDLGHTSLWMPNSVCMQYKICPRTDVVFLLIIDYCLAETLIKFIVVLITHCHK